MSLVKDASVKKFVLKALDEELKDLKSAYDSGVWNSEQYKKRKTRLMDKKKSVRAGTYDL